MYNYGNCHVCGGKMEAKRTKQEFWVRKKLIVIEDVPAGVCVQCGEKVVNADVGQGISAVLTDAGRRRRSRTIVVPVIRFAGKVA